MGHGSMGHGSIRKARKARVPSSSEEDVHPDEAASYVALQRVAERRANVGNDGFTKTALTTAALDVGLNSRKSALETRRASRGCAVRLTNRWIRFVCLFYLVLHCSRAEGVGSFASTFEDMEGRLLAALPFTEREFIIMLKSLWWFGACETMGSYWKVLSDICIACATRKAEVDGVECDANFQSRFKPNIVHETAKRFVNEHFVRQSFFGVHRVQPVHPAEIKAGIEALDTSFTYDAQIATYCSVESVVGRRGPATINLMWPDVVFVRQAVQLKDKSLVHGYGCVLRFRSEKVLDVHNSTNVILDVSGDQGLLEELLLVPSMQLLNLAVGMGVVDAAAVAATPLGGELPMRPEAQHWYVFCHHQGHLPNRALPMSIGDMYALADAIFQRDGQAFKGTRSYRRGMVNAVLSQLIASGDVAGLHGTVAMLSRLGGWAQQDMDRSTIWEVYTSTATDNQGMDMLMVNAGRQPVNRHKVKVRLAGLAQLTSATAVQDTEVMTNSNMRRGMPFDVMAAITSDPVVSVAVSLMEAATTTCLGSCLKDSSVMRNIRFQTPYEAFTQWTKLQLGQAYGPRADCISVLTLGQQDWHWHSFHGQQLSSAGVPGELLQYMEANKRLRSALDPAIRAAQVLCPDSANVATWQQWVVALASIGVFGVTNKRTAGHKRRHRKPAGNTGNGTTATQPQQQLATGCFTGQHQQSSQQLTQDTSVAAANAGSSGTPIGRSSQLPQQRPSGSGGAGGDPPGGDRRLTAPADSVPAGHDKCDRCGQIRHSKAMRRDPASVGDGKVCRRICILCLLHRLLLLLGWLLWLHCHASLTHRYHSKALLLLLDLLLLLLRHARHLWCHHTLLLSLAHCTDVCCCCGCRWWRGSSRRSSTWLPLLLLSL